MVRLGALDRWVLGAVGLAVIGLMWWAVATLNKSEVRAAAIEVILSRLQQDVTEVKADLKNNATEVKADLKASAAADNAMSLLVQSLIDRVNRLEDPRPK
jgi:hypothetical protein